MITEICRSGGYLSLGGPAGRQANITEPGFMHFGALGASRVYHGSKNKAGQQKHEIIEVTFAQQVEQKSPQYGRQCREPRVRQLWPGGQGARYAAADH